LLELPEELVNGQQERCRWHRKPAEGPGPQWLRGDQRRRWRRWLLRGHQEVTGAVCTGRSTVRSGRTRRPGSPGLADWGCARARKKAGPGFFALFVVLIRPSPLIKVFDSMNADGTTNPSPYQGLRSSDVASSFIPRYFACIAAWPN
jgi:hypothetical protein